MQKHVLLLTWTNPRIGGLGGPWSVGLAAVVPTCWKFTLSMLVNEPSLRPYDRL